jgi:DNA-nicking Smr family endonuclease
MGKSRTPNDEERLLWRQVTRDVQPLRPREPEPDPVRQAQPEPIPTAPVAARPSAVKPPAEPASPRRLRLGDVSGIDGHRADKLRRGKTVVEARLDLHGLRQVEAHEALIGFVGSAYRRGLKTILVITGKGSFGRGDSVLRSSVPLWLNEPTLRQKILAVIPAHPRDGGDGALYVMIRRMRDPG